MPRAKSCWNWAEDDGEAQRKVERKKKFGKEAREWVILIACTLLAVFLVRTYVFEPIVVDGPVRL